ncbi:hypothetical protein H920_11839 [Fukomys damarensis]|uniref:Uncharacterized protein n=1 Tax=Fukomys damarensis TaxID=885580 RepID=A0A091DVD2_FUKDA|nr:hypothetical protein H920_11839 [Fukomys damarensis]
MAKELRIALLPSPVPGAERRPVPTDVQVYLSAAGSDVSIDRRVLRCLPNHCSKGPSLANRLNTTLAD